MWNYHQYGPYFIYIYTHIPLYVYIYDIHIKSYKDLDVLFFEKKGC